MIRRVRLRALAFLPLLIAPACGSKGGTPADNGNAPVPGGTLAQGTTTLTADKVADVDVQSDRVVFAAAAHADVLKLAAGVVLMGERSLDPASKNTHGFLRKVVSVAQTGDTIVVMTSGASLLDAFDDLEFQGTLQTPDLGITGPATQANGARTGLHPLGGGAPIKVIDFSGTEIFHLTGDAPIGNATPPHTIGYDAHAKLTKGTLTFTPSWDVGAKIGKLSFDPKKLVKEAHAIGTGQLDAELEVDAGFQLTGNATGDDLAALIAQKLFKSQDAKIADYDVNLGSLQVGPISAPASAHFTATITCDMNWGGGVGVVVGGKASAKVSAGFRYENGQITPVFDKTASLSMTGPAFTAGGALGALCTVKPEFDLQLFGVAAAEIGAEPYVSIGAEAGCGPTSAPKLSGTVSGYAEAGISASAHAKVDVFGLIEWEKSCKLFDVKTPPATVSESFPLPGGQGATCTPQATPQRPQPQDNPLPSCFGGGSAGASSAGAGSSGSGSAGSSTGASPGDGGSGGSAGGAAGGTSGGVSNPGGCLPPGEQPPSTWTCDAAKYGDCACDCGCGAQDRDCKAGECSACDHDVCTAGTPLGRSCTTDAQNGDCIRAICDADPYCCEKTWGASCVDKVVAGAYACTARKCP